MRLLPLLPQHPQSHLQLFISNLNCHRLPQCYNGLERSARRCWIGQWGWDHPGVVPAVMKSLWRTCRRCEYWWHAWRRSRGGAIFLTTEEAEEVVTYAISWHSRCPVYCVLLQGQCYQSWSLPQWRSFVDLDVWRLGEVRRRWMASLKVCQAWDKVQLT